MIELNYKDICKVYTKAEIKEEAEYWKEETRSATIEMFGKKVESNDMGLPILGSSPENKPQEISESGTEIKTCTANIKHIESIYAVWLKALAHKK